MAQIFDLGNVYNMNGIRQVVNLDAPLVILGSAAIGVAVGLAIGGPTGAVVGALVGAFVGVLAVGAIRRIRVIFHGSGRVEVEMDFQRSPAWA